MPADHTLVIKFPRGKNTCSIGPVPLAVSGMFPKIENWNGFSYVSVKMISGAQPTVTGFGKPFANPDDEEVEGWVNHMKPITQGATLLDVFLQREFFFVVPTPVAPLSKSIGDALLPPVFTYGYSPQPFDEESMIALVDKNSGVGFLAPCASVYSLMPLD